MQLFQAQHFLKAEIFSWLQDQGGDNKAIGRYLSYRRRQYRDFRFVLYSLYLFRQENLFAHKIPVLK